MTRAEWDAVMLRFMHRQDVQADLEDVFRLAVARVREGWMRGDLPFADDDALLAYAGRALHHAGLMHLHELAQDDSGLGRERYLFEYAMSDIQFRWSLDNVTPVAVREGVDDGT